MQRSSSRSALCFLLITLAIALKVAPSGGASGSGASSSGQGPPTDWTIQPSESDEIWQVIKDAAKNSKSFRNDATEHDVNLADHKCHALQMTLRKIVHGSIDCKTTCHYEMALVHATILQSRKIDLCYVSGSPICVRLYTTRELTSTSDWVKNLIPDRDNPMWKWPTESETKAFSVSFVKKIEKSESKTTKEEEEEMKQRVENDVQAVSQTSNFDEFLNLWTNRITGRKDIVCELTSRGLVQIANQVVERSGGGKQLRRLDGGLFQNVLESACQAIWNSLAKSKTVESAGEGESKGKGKGKSKGKGKGKDKGKGKGKGKGKEIIEEEVEVESKTCLCDMDVQFSKLYKTHPNGIPSCHFEDIVKRVDNVMQVFGWQRYNQVALRVEFDCSEALDWCLCSNGVCDLAYVFRKEPFDPTSQEEQERMGTGTIFNVYENRCKWTWTP
jgi:hypothetical protein